MNAKITTTENPGSAGGSVPTRRSRRSRLVVAALAATALTVGVGGAATAAPLRPDLVVTAVKWAPIDPVAGQQVRFSAVVTNQGTAATPEGTITGVAFEVDGTKRTWSDTSTQALPPGGRVTLTANWGPAGSATWTARSGAHTVRAVVDDVARIPELREDDNTLSAKVSVAAGLSVRTGGGAGLVVGMANLNRPTVLTTSTSGDLYAGCRTPDGVLVDGTEQFVSAWTFGRDRPAYGAKFNDGSFMVPAAATRQEVGVELVPLLYSYQGRDPITCAAGQRAGWTVFRASSVTATRWPGEFGADGPVLARVTVPVDTVLPIGA